MDVETWTLAVAPSGLDPGPIGGARRIPAGAALVAWGVVGAYFIRRLLIAIPVLIGITMAAFFVLSAAPGDPVLARLDPEVLARLTPADIEARRRELGLDQPVPIRYVRLAGRRPPGRPRLLDRERASDRGGGRRPSRPIADADGRRRRDRAPRRRAVRGDLGRQPVRSRRLRPVGVHDLPDQHAHRSCWGSVALYLFGVTLKVLPVGELFTFGKEDDLVDRAAHIVMPAMILGLANAALLMRYTRASMLEVLEQRLHHDRAGEGPRRAGSSSSATRCATP